MTGKSGKSTNIYAAQEEFLDWEEKLQDLAETSEKERWVEGRVWELWKSKVIKAGKKRVNQKVGGQLR